MGRFHQHVGQAVLVAVGRLLGREHEEIGAGVCREHLCLRLRAQPVAARRDSQLLGLLLYVPLLWPVLGISMLVAHFNDSGRLLHDLAGGTIVVADPRLDPEEQRQRALALSFGKTS